jgi:cysteine desulfurase
MTDVTYLDHAATTPMRPQAVAAMVLYLTDRLGNPSGAHRMARHMRAAVDDARDIVADALGFDPGEIVFTGGGTEADNAAVLGAGPAGGVAVCSAVEHHAVLHPVRASGGRVIGVDADGVIDLEALGAALGPDVRVVSVMLANNETGMVQPLAEVAELVHSRAPQAVLHTDAVQAFAWVDVASVVAVADLVSLSAHKFGGPQGVGVLAVRDHVDFTPLLTGGGQERDRRAGTHNVPGIVALAEAVRVTAEERKPTVDRVSSLRDRLADGLLRAVPGTIESGRRAGKIAGNCHLCFPGIESEALLFLLEEAGVMASAAASCASGAQEPSHVLAAMGYERDVAAGSLRLSLGWPSTDADVDRALAVIPPAVAQLHAGRPTTDGDSR